MMRQRLLKFCVSLTYFINAKSQFITPDTQKLLNMSMGALFAAPIPEKYEAAGAEIQKAVEQAIQESEENGMSKRGKEVTPWLLNRVSELTGGSSMENSKCLHRLVFANRSPPYPDLALLRNTAFVGEFESQAVLLFL